MEGSVHQGERARVLLPFSLPFFPMRSVRYAPYFFINSALCLMIMSNDEVKGKAKQIKGDIREGVGKLTNNKAEQVKGKIEQIEGVVQEEIGKTKRKSKK